MGGGPYRCAVPPEIPAWIAAARSASTAGRFATIEWVAETGSTNSDLSARAADRAVRELVLVADHQTAGRGRLDRQWLALPGQNLLLSVLIRPECPPERWPLATSAMAVAVVDVVAAFGIAHAGIRWPNDVVVDGGPAPGKLAGVLAELMLDGTRPAAVVVGVGLNVAWPIDAEARRSLAATSLAACRDEVPGRGDLLAAVLARFATVVWLVETEPRRLRELHLARSLTVGRDVRVARADGTSLEGRAVDIDEAGRIVVRASGVDEVLSAGDVTHLR